MQVLCWQVLGVLLESQQLGCLLGRLREWVSSARSAVPA